MQLEKNEIYVREMLTNQFCLRSRSKFLDVVYRCSDVACFVCAIFQEQHRIWRILKIIKFHRESATCFIEKVMINFFSNSSVLYSVVEKEKFISRGLGVF